jgi:hypothetical protein
MSDNQNDNARRFLHELQESYGIPNQYISRQDVEYLLKLSGWDIGLSEQEKEQILKLVNESGGLDGVIRQVADDALDMMSEEYRVILKNVPVGLIDTHSPYGEVRASPGGQEIIVFHRGIMLFIHDMSRIIIAGMLLAPSLSHDKSSLLIITLARKALHVSLLFLADCHLKGTHFVEMNPELDFQADYVCRSIEIFCMLHEYAHILQRHNMQEQQLKIDYSINQMSLKQKQEIQADIWATKTIIGSDYRSCYDLFLEEKANKWKFVTPIIFFSMLSFIEAVLINTKEVENGMKVHNLPKEVKLCDYPPAAMRYKIAQGFLFDNIEVSSDIRQMCEMVWQLTEMLWDICKVGLSEGLYRDIIC